MAERKEGKKEADNNDQRALSPLKYDGWQEKSGSKGELEGGGKGGGVVSLPLPVWFFITAVFTSAVFRK